MFRLPNAAVLVPLHFKNKVTVKIPCIKVEACRKKIFYQTQYLSFLANIYMFNFSWYSCTQTLNQICPFQGYELTLLTNIPLKAFWIL